MEPDRPGKQCELGAMHHDDGSLALCLRRAIQAAEELFEAGMGGGEPARR